MSKTFASLSIPNYRIWFIGTTFAATAVWMQRVAQDWVVLTDLTNKNATAVGIVTALQFLPQLFLSPYAGKVIDRLDRRRLIQFTQGAMALIAMILSLLLYFEVAHLYHFYILAFLGGLVQTFDNPARQIFVNELVPPRSVPNAVALNSASFNLARMIGPAVAGYTLAWMGSWLVFAVNAALLLGPIIALAVMDQTEFHPAVHPKRGSGQIREGLRYIMARRDIVAIMVVASVVSCLGLNFQLTSAVMANVEFHRGSADFGLLGSVMAIGSLTGALVAARRAVPRVRTVVAAAFGFGVVEGIMALAPNYYVFAVLAVPLGFFALTMITSANAAIQISCDPMVRGRVMSIYSMVFLGTVPVGAPIIGWISENWGARWGLGVGSIACLLVSGVVGMIVFRKWGIDLQMRSKAPFVEVVGPRDRYLGLHPEAVDQIRTISIEEAFARQQQAKDAKEIKQKAKKQKKHR
ncbi:MFS transporter [Boudabousia tangfeifanii]|uniref:MFS transporter n=1 Tax=Boudabousia tangfeifanii TaxID=1912795 RepID=A0A1D9ML10_9ACTO|nr:MFS transporter [Boudabousia tangfeifanii]AOZ72972.1 MFS transporter [Boudabousia tangfeifanii]